MAAPLRPSTGVRCRVTTSPEYIFLIFKPGQLPIQLLYSRFGYIQVSIRFLNEPSTPELANTFSNLITIGFAVYGGYLATLETRVPFSSC